MIRSSLIALLLLVAVNVQQMPRPVLGLAHTPAPFLASPRDASVPQGRLPIRLQSAGGGGGGAQLQVSDLSCTGAFLTPANNPGFGGGGDIPIAMRYESGFRHYFMMNGSDGHILEFPEPTLSSCSAAFTSMNRASLEGWGGDWGPYKFGAGFNSDAGCDATPGCNGTGLVGLRFDGAGNLTAGWSGNYAAVGVHNSFASMTLDNVAHTMSTNGCWGVTGFTQPYIAGAIITIPAAFVAANLPSGHNFGVMGGWPFATVGAGISEGPTMYALAPPASNACTASTDTLLAAGTALQEFPANGDGPNCNDGVTSFGIGCTPPVTTITTPYPKQLALTHYSRDTYATDWEPYPVGAPTHGWVGFTDYGGTDWYDDGVKHAIATVMVAPEGWINTTVASSSSSTAFVSSSTDTHDGLNINVGDLIWMQTCTVNVDPGCNGDQSHFLSQWQVTSVNTSTHAITGTVTEQDNSSGNHFPVPGGPVLFGCHYAFGTPTCSRWQIRAQFDDPADLALVAGGSKAAYSVVSYDDEEIGATLIPGYGAPSTGDGAHFQNEQEAGISSLTADPIGHNLIVSGQNANNPTFFTSNVLYILHINEPMPMPSEMLGSMGLIYLLSLAGWGRLTRRVS